MKVNSIKLSEYFQLVKAEYTVLKLIPDTSIRNYNSDVIARAVASLYRPLMQHMKLVGKTLKIEQAFKVSFMIDMKAEETILYMIIPKGHLNFFKEKITSVWNKITIAEVESIPEFSKDALKYYMSYKYEDPLSLSIDKKCNEPLNSLMNVIDILKENDRVGVFYNFMPASQATWRRKFDTTMKRIKNNEPVEREILSPEYLLKSIFGLFRELLAGIEGAMNNTIGVKDKQNIGGLELAITQMLFNDKREISQHSHNKKDSTILNTQIVVAAESPDQDRKRNIINSVRNAFDSLSADNELTSHKMKGSLDYYKFKIPGADVNKMSIAECQNFFEVPGRELLDRFKMITKVDTLETQVPPELQQGTKLICREVVFKGNSQKAFLTTDKDYKNLAVVVIGPTRSGKTSFLANLAKNCVDAGECVIVPDFIETCELSKEIAEFFPDNKKIVIDLSELKRLPAFCYIEGITDNQDPVYIYDNLKRQANLLSYLINSVNVENKELAPRMDKYLQAASIVVYSQNGPTIDVLNALEDWEVRDRYINNIPENLKTFLKGSITDLEQLDEWSKPTKDNPVPEKIGTHISYINGVTDRFYILKKNTAMEIMLNNRPEGQLNFVNEIQKGQLIVIKMPEATFPTEEERDIMTTYWITKIYLSGQVRADKIRDRYQRTTVNVITDELAQLESAEKFIGSRLDKTAKFGIKFIISTMYINQLRIRDKLRNANTSYIFIAGSDKVNYAELKDELSQQGYSLEDMMNMKRYQSLNYIKYEQGYASFIGWLPKPLK